MFKKHQKEGKVFGTYLSTFYTKQRSIIKENHKDDREHAMNVTMWEWKEVVIQNGCYFWISLKKFGSYFGLHSLNGGSQFEISFRPLK